MLVVAGERLARYGFGDGHPFGPDRHAAFHARVHRARARQARAHRGNARRPSREELQSFHTPHYVDLVRERSATGEGYLDAGDTPALRGVYEAAADVVGATLLAVEQIMAGNARRAFVPIAGLHHAARGRAAGFCVFNDCGVAIEMLRRNHGLKRIAYVDIDAHHGDGVFYGFEDDPDLIFADMHEDGRYLYPGTGVATETGAAPALGTKLNIPVPPGASDEHFARRVAAGASAPARVRARVHPAPVRRRQRRRRSDHPPALHARTPTRTPPRDLCALADELGHGRVLGIGGGGYNRSNLAQAWTRGRSQALGRCAAGTLTDVLSRRLLSSTIRGPRNPTREALPMFPQPR